LTLPNGLDIERAEANFENGMLSLSIPRAEAAKPRQIPVKVVSDGHVAVAAGVGTEAQPEQAAQA
jgi:HSP20 family protein